MAATGRRTPLRGRAPMRVVGRRARGAGLAAAYSASTTTGRARCAHPAHAVALRAGSAHGGAFVRCGERRPVAAMA